VIVYCYLQNFALRIIYQKTQHTWKFFIILIITWNERISLKQPINILKLIKNHLLIVFSNSPTWSWFSDHWLGKFSVRFSTQLLDTGECPREVCEYLHHQQSGRFLFENLLSLRGLYETARRIFGKGSCPQNWSSCWRVCQKFWFEIKKTRLL